jgi:hypothetical protein
MEIHEKNKIARNITLSIQSGGMIQFGPIRIYPEYLLFNSPQLRRTWHFKRL